MNAASCPKCYGGNPRCPLCRGTGIFDASNPAVIPMLGDLGFEWGDISSGLATMGSDMVKNLAIQFPKIAVSTITSMVSGQIAQQVAPSGGSATTKTTTQAAPAAAPAPAAVAQGQVPAQPSGQIIQYVPVQAAPTQSSTPAWILPAGLVAGGVALAAVLFVALRKKD